MRRKSFVGSSVPPGAAERERRNLLRRREDEDRRETARESMRKLQSLLELGQLIGLDLQLREMLLQLARKAAEVMEADRCSLFLYDSKIDRLWSTVALGMGEQTIHIPSGSGVAGYCFQTGQAVNLEDAYLDPRFNREVDARTGYRTKSLLSMPLFNRAGDRVGVIQLLNKKDGGFTAEDEAFLTAFANHASVFIEIAQLQKARIDALEQSRQELERLNRAKTKALDHLSHELRTPLAVIQGHVRILKRKLQSQVLPFENERLFETIERHLNRLLDIQQETDKILRSDQEGEEETLPLPSFTTQVLERIKQRTPHRALQFSLEGSEGLLIRLDPNILDEMVEGLLKNAIENTPDGGLIKVLLTQTGHQILLKVQDYGVGITEENQKSIFEGLFHARETELYASKRPYDFGAGGKGLDLLRTKVYSRRFGFDVLLESRRCIYLPTDRDLCPGRISACAHCRDSGDCLSSGGSIFTLSFPRLSSPGA